MVVLWGLDNLSSVTYYCLTAFQNLVALKNTHTTAYHFPQFHCLVQWFFCKSHLGSLHSASRLAGGWVGQLGFSLWFFILSLWHGGLRVPRRQRYKCQSLGSRTDRTLLSPYYFGQSKSQGWPRYEAWGNRLLILMKSCKIWPHFKSTEVMYAKHSYNKH